LADHGAAAVANFDEVAVFVSVARQPACFRQAAGEFADWPGEPFFTLLLGPGRILCGIVGKQHANEPLAVVAAVYRRLCFEGKAVAAAGTAGNQTAVESQPS
jgi:hypothetical protein